MHYDLYGNIDRWGSKYEQYIFPLMILGFALFWQILQNHYEKKAQKLNDSKEGREAASNAKVLSYAAVGTTLMFVVMHFCFLYGAYTEAKHNASVSSIDINQIVGVLMGLLLMATGNYMPKSRRNPVLGFRTKKDHEQRRKLGESQSFCRHCFSGFRCADSGTEPDFRRDHRNDAVSWHFAGGCCALPYLCGEAVSA